MRRWPKRIPLNAGGYMLWTPWLVLVVAPWREGIKRGRWESTFEQPRRDGTEVAWRFPYVTVGDRVIGVSYWGWLLQPIPLDHPDA